MTREALLLLPSVFGLEDLRFHLQKKKKIMLTSNRELYVYMIMIHMHINNITTKLLTRVVVMLFLAYYQFHHLFV